MDVVILTNVSLVKVEIPKELIIAFEELDITGGARQKVTRIYTRGGEVSDVLESADEVRALIGGRSIT